MKRRAPAGAVRANGPACIIAICVAAWGAAWSIPGAGGALYAQVPGDTLTVAAGARYDAHGFIRFMNGANWRDLWVQPVRVPVLDVRTFAGGLTPLRAGGGNQSITLHFTDAQGMRWIFRSIDKFPERNLGAELTDTPASDIVQDHISALNPGSHFVMPALLEAAGVLHVRPRLFIMPDDPALGEHRRDFAGMLGELEERPDEGPDGTPGFAGSLSVKNTENFLDDLEDSPEHQLDEAEFLRARLVDMLVGDPDRGTDQWRFARFGDGPYTWRPIPADRDWALVRADGALVRLARRFYPKPVRFGDRYASVEAMTYSSHAVDRRLLTRLTRSDFAREGAHLQQVITDDVIAQAVAGMPPEYVALRGDEIASMLRARRDQLPAVAEAFYEWLATDVDVRGTDESDFAWIERRADGTVRVVLRSEAAPVMADLEANGAAGTGGIYYDRVFLPRETREVRVYLHGGDDHARVVGPPDGPILVRIIGGGGDDLLEDLAGGARLYDHRGDNRIGSSANTRFDDSPWIEPDSPEGLRANVLWAQNWGSDGGIGPAVTYRERAGFLLGAGAEFTRYGFRRAPYHWQAAGSVQYAPETGGIAAGLVLDYRMQNSSRSVNLAFDASNAETFRFNGFGNESSFSEAGGDVRLHRLTFRPSLVWHIGPRAGQAVNPDGSDEADDVPEDDEGAAAAIRWAPDAPRRLTGSFEVGPAFAWTNPRLADAAAFAVTTDAVTQVGMRALLDVRRTDRSAAPRRGFRVQASAAGYPLVTGVAEAAGSGDMAAHVAASVATYVPLLGDGLHLALRAGGEHAFGAYPFFDAPFLGGRHSLRGLPAYRYAGDATAFGGAELRMPLDSLVLLVRMETGVFAFADAGRVWHGGASPGGWHTGLGGGAWFAAFGRSASIAVARGEGTRLYAWFGMPF